MTLKEIVNRAEDIIPSVDFANEFSLYSPSESVREWMTEPNGKYYRGLAALCKLRSVKRALELGTRHGGSAIAMAKFARSVTTCDIDDSVLIAGLAKKNICFKKLAKPDDCLNQRFSDHDLIFIDIGDHSGYYESELHQKLLNEYRGLAAYDDINWPGMKNVWASIKQEKCETDWHGKSGFGLVNYAS